MGLGQDLLNLFRKEGGKSKLEVVEFAPIEQSKLLTMTAIRMIATVGGKHEPGPGNDGPRWELLGGHEYMVSPDMADEFIIQGWAVGKLSRRFSEDEILERRSKTQNITLGPVKEVNGG